jgi:putative transposase
LSFFTLALVSVKQRLSYPVRVEQTVRSAEEKASSQSKKQAQKAKSEAPKRKRGHPKGSCNKEKAEIQRMIQALMETISGKIHLTYLVLDGHFGNHPALDMVRQCQLHLISKLRSDAALFFPYSGLGPKRGPRPRLGERLDYHKMPDQYLNTTLVEDGIETRIYQLPLLHCEFSIPLNVVILIKTNLDTKVWAHVILFSNDLDLAYDKLFDFYSMRFQIEFNFRDAK